MKHSKNICRCIKQASSKRIKNITSAHALFLKLKRYKAVKLKKKKKLKIVNLIDYNKKGELKKIMKGQTQKKNSIRCIFQYVRMLLIFYNKNF